MGRARYTDERLIELLRDFAKDLGRTPTQFDLDFNPDMPSTGTYHCRFGSFKKALALASVPTSSTPYRWDDTEMLSRLEHKIKELGKIPTSVEINKDPEMPSATAYARHFGNVEKAAALTKKAP